MSHWNHCLYVLSAVGHDNQASNEIIEEARAIVALVSIYPIVTIVRTHRLRSDV
jgi:hypothetical protein